MTVSPGFYLLDSYFVAYRGITNTFTLAFINNQTNAPLNLTGDSITLLAKNSLLDPDSMSAITANTANGKIVTNSPATLGLATLTIGSADTENIGMPQNALLYFAVKVYQVDGTSLGPVMGFLYVPTYGVIN